MGFAKDNDTNCIPKAGTDASYEDLLRKIIRHNQKLEFSEEETVRFIFVKNVSVIGIQQR